jgi:hypothetical protein
VLSCVLMCSVWYMVTTPQVVLLLCMLVPLCNPKSVVLFRLTTTGGHYIHKPCSWARNAIRGGAPNSVFLPPIHDVFAAIAAVRMTTVLKVTVSVLQVARCSINLKSTTISLLRSIKFTVSYQAIYTQSYAVQ